MWTKSVGGKGDRCSSICGGIAMICETTALSGSSCGSWSTKAPPELAPIAATGAAASDGTLAFSAPTAFTTAGPSSSNDQHRRKTRSCDETASTA